jgi:hypothetical protein
MFNKKVKIMSKVESYLLLPLPEKAGRYYRFVDYYRIPLEGGGYNVTYVVACNSKNKDDIRPLLTSLLATMMDVYSVAPVLKNDVARLQNVVNKLNSVDLERWIPQEQLDHVCRRSTQKFTPDEVIYLSPLVPGQK